MKNKGINRRDFLRLSATGVGAFILPSTVSATVFPDEETQSEAKKIPVRTLGRTGIELPILSMGVMRADNPNLLRVSYNSGLVHFDTANGYQNGRNEEMVGNFFKDKPRDSFIVSTKVKCGYPLSENFETELDAALAVSLGRLQMDYVDIFYAHALSTVEAVNDPRALEALKKIKSDGRARFLGFSTHASKPAQIDAAIEAGIYDVILLTYNFKLENLEETNAAIERAAKAGIGLIAMKTMTGGVADAEGHKKIDAKACLKWAWQNKNITTIIPGYTNYDEFEDCMAAAHDPKLTGDQEKYLAVLKNSEMMFCQQCGACVGQCQAGLPIPDIMRAYMYTYGYKFSQLSKETLAELDLPNNICADCDSCSVKCPSGFDVAKKIAAITPVVNIPNEFLT